MEPLAEARSFSRAELVGLLVESQHMLDWAVARTPAAAYYQTPTAGAAAFQEGAWSLAANLAHLALYEERLAVPLLIDLLAGGDGCREVMTPREYWPEADALSTEPVSDILERVRKGRQQQVALVEAFSAERLNTRVVPLFGPRFGAPLHSPAWVAAKSVQHTYEHGNAIFRIALFSPQ
ncbi:MAG: DinB family protein [Dehalococcoidia bacterium]